MSQADKSTQEPHMNNNGNNNAMNMGMPGMAAPIGAPNMNNGQPPNNEKTLLNTYIYDYFLKNHMYDCADAILREAQVNLDGPNQRTSPSRRAPKHDADGNIMTNGLEDNMDGADGSAPRKTEGGDDSKGDWPAPSVPQNCPQGCFLFDWWCLFWDIFGVRTAGKGTMQANAYLTNTQRIRQQQEQLMLQRLNPQLQGQVPSQMNPGPNYQNPMLRQGYPNGVMLGQDGVPAGMGPENKHLVRQALMNNNKRAPPAQQINALKAQQPMQQTGQRDQDVDMNGQQPRPQSPAGNQAAASPGTKRRNLGGGDYQEVGPGGQRQTPAGAAGTAQATQAHQILVANGIDPARLTPQQFAAFQLQNPNAQARSIQLYAQSLAQHAHQQRTVLQQGMPKGMTHVQGNPAAHAGSPMMPHNPEGAPMNMMGEFYGAGAQMRAGQAPGSGSHALQDYQMQLMLLEQQNKKRLLMARQEQDNIGRAEQGSNNFPGMSPQGNRAAPSPQPPGDMKRGTPKMNPQAGPGSPLPDGQISGQQQRGSPATSMPGFNGQQMDGSQNMFYNPNKQMNEMLANGSGLPGVLMRPPGHAAFNGQLTPQQMQQVEAMNNNNLRQQQQAGRGQPPGVWPHPGMNAQIMQQQAQAQAAQAQAAQAQAQAAQAQAQAQAHAQQNQAQAQAQNAGTPGQARQNVNHSAMPPPSAPATQVNGRAPSSPSVNNQHPPTPTQGNKAAPNKRKETKERKKKVNAAPVQAPSAATPSSEPPTPTTPITPQHSNSFAVHKGNFNTSAPGQGNNGAQNSQQSQPSAATSQPIQQPDSLGANAFSGIPENSLFDDFAGEAGNDTLLDNFDFDSFLNNPDEGGSTGFLDASGFNFPDAVEAGAGDS